jgi:hypothetical protein
LREREFAIAAARLRLVQPADHVRELVPNATRPIVVAATLNVAKAILLESYVSYLGYGIQPPAAELGQHAQQAQIYLTSAPWLAIAPGRHHSGRDQLQLPRRRPARRARSAHEHPMSEPTCFYQFYFQENLMSPPLSRITSDERLPAQADVVVIGGGVIGVSAAYHLAKKGLSVALVEKGHVGAEQSSRNWGWCRQQGRARAEIPLAREALRLWEDMQNDAGVDAGFAAPACCS